MFSSGESKGFRWISGLIGSLFIGAIFAGLAFTIKTRSLEVSPAASGIFTSSTVVKATLLLGIQNPKSDTDKLYALKLPEKQVVEQSVPLNWRVAHLYEANTLSIQFKDDGSTVLTGSGWNVPLRARSGQPYTTIQVLGMWDANHAALIGITDGDRVLLSVSRIGEVRVLFSFPETVLFLRMQDGRAWFSTFQMGEGIESAPQGPSRLFYALGNGATSTVALETRVITSVVPGQDRALAYGFDDIGNVVVSSTHDQWQGKGFPLAWLDADHLFLSRGTEIYLLDLRQPSLLSVGSLPSTPRAAVVTSTAL